MTTSETNPRPYGEGGDIPSPCTGHCRVDAATGTCEGCLRTQQEISAWWRMPDDGRSEVLKRVETRKLARDGNIDNGIDS